MYTSDRKWNEARKIAFEVYIIDQKEVLESAYVTFDDSKCPRLEDDDETECASLRIVNEHIRKWESDHTADRIGNPEIGARATRDTQNEYLYGSFLFQVNSKKFDDASMDPNWITSMEHIKAGSKRVRLLPLMSD
ncbi:hypothetical protein AgCh_010960 [Apium graveolens]